MKCLGKAKREAGFSTLSWKEIPKQKRGEREVGQVQISARVPGGAPSEEARPQTGASAFRCVWRILRLPLMQTIPKSIKQSFSYAHRHCGSGMQKELLRSGIVLAR